MRKIQLLLGMTGGLEFGKASERLHPILIEQPECHLENCVDHTDGLRGIVSVSWIFVESQFNLSFAITFCVRKG